MPVPMLKRKQELLSLLHQLLPLLLPLLLPQLLQQHQHLLRLPLPLLRRLPLLLQLLPRSEDNNEGNNKKCSSVI